MKKLFTIFAAAITLGLCPSLVLATDYILARAIITWSDGDIDDSLTGAFGINGTMNISNGTVTQHLTFCRSDKCEVVIDDIGTVTSIGINDANVSIRSADGSIGELTLIALAPSIITMFVYPDGTIEMHEWRINQEINANRNSFPIRNRNKLGTIGRSIAFALRPNATK